VDSRRAVLSFGGIGFLPGPSGTYASLATCAVVALAHGVAPSFDAWAVLAAVALGTIATLALGNGLSGPGGHGDPSWVVTDEVAGQGLALLVAGLSPHRGLLTFAASFALFRGLDIVKPGPIGAAEKLPGGLGILCDDLLAGAVAGAAVLGAAALIR